MENPEREKPRAAMNERFTMVMGQYRISLKVICPKKRSTSNYGFTHNALSQNKNSGTIGLSGKEQSSRCSNDTCALLMCFISLGA